MPNMDNMREMVIHLERQAAEDIEAGFRAGIHPNDSFQGKSLFSELITGYKRGPTFKECVRVFVAYGLVFSDPLLLTVLLDDASGLEWQLMNDPDGIHRRYSLACAFTPLYEVSLLHICAEFNHLSCANVLIEKGLDVNIRAGMDVDQMGGHTPIFHTVNQFDNFNLDFLQKLLDCSADLGVTVSGLIWGKGYEWETWIPAVNPISYAMMGLLPQFQRKEADVYHVVEKLCEVNYQRHYQPINVPNRYLKH